MGVQSRRQGMATPAVIVSDRREEIWAAWSPHDDLALPSQRAILGWLEFVEITR